MSIRSNARKRDREAWFMAFDRIEHGAIPAVQGGKVECPAEWMGPPRPEPFVFVVSGRNVAPGRFRRCLALGPRCTVVRNRRRRGLLANTVTAIHTVTAIQTVCTDPETVIVTLDADDALIGDRVLERLAVEFASNADVTVGSMLCTDKEAT